MDYLEEYYNQYDEEGRLLSRQEALIAYGLERTVQALDFRV